METIFSNSERTFSWTNWFELPFITAKIRINETKMATREIKVTLSDHEPVISTIYGQKWEWPTILN